MKACCGAGLGRGLVGPFFCGTSGPGAVRYGLKEGRAKDDLRVSRSPATLMLPFPFLPPPEETRERERECDKKAMGVRSSGDRVSRSLMLPVYRSPFISSGKDSCCLLSIYFVSTNQLSHLLLQAGLFWSSSASIHDRSFL